MIGDVIYPLNAILFDTGVFEVVSEMNSDVSVLSVVTRHCKTFLSRLRIVLWSSGIGYRIYFQTSGCHFYHCKHVVFVLVDLWQCDISNLPGFPILIFQPSTPIPERL